MTPVTSVRSEPAGRAGERRPEPKKELLAMYGEMLLLRRFEEAAGRVYTEGKVGGFCHLYIGQEAVAIGVRRAVDPERDYLVNAYRDHGHALAWGTPPGVVMAELYGKSTGAVKGKGGSMHMFDAARHNYGGHGIVGGQIPLAAGVAFSQRYQKKDGVVVCLFGDAAVNIGAFHESLNMAAVWKLPAIFICENNRYGMGTSVERSSAIYDISERACSYDMANEVVDGQDVLVMHAAMDRATQRARNDKLPTLLEVRTYRFMGHSMSDPIHGHYRTREEVEDQRKRDPIAVWLQRLIADGLLDEPGLKALNKEVVDEVEDAYQFAEQAPDPAPEELYT